MDVYMKSSHVMVGDHKKGRNYSNESESYLFSSGQNHPVNWRFKEKNNKKNPKLRRA